MTKNKDFSYRGVHVTIVRINRKLWKTGCFIEGIVHLYTRHFLNLYLNMAAK